MSKNLDQSGFNRRMKIIGKLFDVSRHIVRIGLITFLASLAGMILVMGMGLSIFEIPVIAVVFSSMLMLALGIMGIVVTLLFTMFEAGASGIDWVLGRMERIPEKSKRKVKSDE